MVLIRYIKSNSKCFENSVNLSGCTKATNEMMPVQEKVFQNPLIIPVIMKHALQKRNTNAKNEGTLCMQNAKRLRLVCRAWLLEVNLQFRKSGQPLLFLTPHNFPKFLATTSKGRNNWAPLPPLSLSLSLDSFSFKCISMPCIITRMEMNSRLSLAILVLLRSNILEGMRVLKLDVVTTKNFLEKEDLAIFSRCLNQGALSLEELELRIDDLIFRQNKNLQVALNFPRMTNLKKMKIRGVIWRLDKNSIQSDLGGRLPKLEELKLKQISGYIFFEQWCRNSVFWSVRSLALDLLADVRDVPVRGVPISVETMQQVLRTFPRVVHLQLGWVDARDLNGLRYMFGHLGEQLRSLQLNIVGAVTWEDEIDGLVIGARPERVRRLKEDPALWGRFLDGFMVHKGIYTNSIRDLKMLESLVLQGDILVNTGEGRMRVKNVPSDLAFELGFMQLPALDRLVLEGSFGVSEEMADKWCKQKDGREIEFKRKPAVGWVARGVSEIERCIGSMFVLFFVHLISGRYSWDDKLIEIVGSLAIEYFVLLFMEFVFRGVGYVGGRVSQFFR